MTAVVIVGAGLAGVRVAETLRERGFTGSVTLLGAEADEPYDRPPLSKQVLRGEREPFFLLGSARAAELDIDLRQGAVARGLSGGAVITDQGEVAFEQLVIATGAEPRRLPGAPGLVLRTLSDARALSDRLTPGSRLAIVGAGLIGCEVAASARALGVEVDVVDVLDGPLIRLLGPLASGLVRDLHERHGVRFHLGAGVVAATDRSVSLADGTELRADALLEAMGVVPTTTWLAGSGLDTADGVLCDSSGRAADGVWAVGDVARWDGPEGPVRREHWTSASDQGIAVADGILGAPHGVTGAQYWWSDQYDLKLSGVGATSGDVQLVETGPRRRTLAVYSDAGRVSGVVGFSAGAAVMRARALVGGPVDEVLSALST